MNSQYVVKALLWKNEFEITVHVSSTYEEAESWIGSAANVYKATYFRIEKRYYV